MEIRKKREFNEHISPFLRQKLDELKEAYGEGSQEYLSIARQFLRSLEEDEVASQFVQFRHYDADMSVDTDDRILGVERLYQRTMLIELTTACFSSCRWCLRSNYNRFTLKDEQIDGFIKLLLHPIAKDSVREVLITGGDPFTSLARLEYALEQIVTKAKHIEIVRIGSRVFTHNPFAIDDQAISILKKYSLQIRIEVGTHINSAVEFWDESVAAIEKVQACGVTVYNQHPLLRGVNDSVEALAKLYDSCRKYGIESHYLFHCVPMAGMRHHRTTVDKGLELIRGISSGGRFSGRSKPHYACMTDIGKIVLYEGVIVDRDEESNRLLLQSGYSFEERKKFNPGFKLTENMRVDKNGLLQVWYLDGVR